MAVAISPESTAQSTSGSTTNPITFAGMAAGSAVSDRILVAVLNSRVRGLATGVTIGGETATKAVGVNGGNFETVTEIWYAAVPSGTTADVVATYPNSSAGYFGCSLFRMVGSASSPSDTDFLSSTTDVALTASINVPANGGLIAGACFAEETTAFTWSEATEYQDSNAVAFRDGSAYRNTASILTALGVEARGGGGSGLAVTLCVAAFAEATGGGGTTVGLTSGLVRGRAFTGLLGKNGERLDARDRRHSVPQIWRPARHRLVSGWREHRHLLDERQFHLQGQPAHGRAGGYQPRTRA